MSFASVWNTSLSWSRLRFLDQVLFVSVALGVVFASLGLGEAVYRVLFFEFDGATDRLPIELLFGIVFALLAMRAILKSHRRKMETRARISIIRARNERIRSALAIIAPLPLHQQAIRVIREETEGIEWALADSLPH